MGLSPVMAVCSFILGICLVVNVFTVLLVLGVVHV